VVRHFLASERGVTVTYVGRSAELHEFRLAGMTPAVSLPGLLHREDRTFYHATSLEALKGIVSSRRIKAAYELGEAGRSSHVGEAVLGRESLAEASGSTYDAGVVVMGRASGIFSRYSTVRSRATSASWRADWLGQPGHHLRWKAGAGASILYLNPAALQVKGFF
jgi:hypothetical protein